MRACPGRVARVHRAGSVGLPECDERVRTLSDDVVEQREDLRAHFRVIRTRRSKLACACCDLIVQAAALSRPVCRGINHLRYCADSAWFSCRLKRKTAMFQYAPVIGTIALLVWWTPRLLLLRRSPQIVGPPGWLPCRGRR